MEQVADLTQLARDLAAFLSALYSVDPADGPPPGPHSFFRGGPLETYDRETREAIAALADEIEPDAALAVWEDALAGAWRRPPVWVHGDVTGSNLLLRESRLSAVLDFGCCAVGDPACDLAITWTLFSGESREEFRRGLDLDPDTWSRGRAWAFWKALITLAHSTAEEADAAAVRFAGRAGARDVVADVLADRARP